MPDLSALDLPDQAIYPTIIGHIARTTQGGAGDLGRQASQARRTHPGRCRVDDCNVGFLDNDDDGVSEVGPGAAETGTLIGGDHIASGTREDPLPLGTSTLLDDGWEITVVSVIPDATDLILAENQLNDPPELGHQFFIARIRATYREDESDELSDYRFRAVGDSSVAYTTLDNDCGSIPDPLPNAEVFAGGTIEGNVCWSIRASDAESLVLFDCEAGREDRVFLALASQVTDADAPVAPVPTVVGHNELINVQQALAAQDLEAEIGQGTASAREAGITPPGQILTVGDATVYVFIFEDVAQREAASAALDPATLVITSPSGQPLAGPGTERPDIRVAQQSNVIAGLAGGDEELATQFDAAIASLA